METKLAITVVNLDRKMGEELLAVCGDEIPAYFRGQIFQLSAEAPTWIQVIGDVINWTLPLKAAAAVFLSELAKSAASDAWKNKAVAGQIVRERALAPLVRFASTLFSLHKQASNNNGIRIALDRGDDIWGTGISFEPVDEIHAIWIVACFVNLAPQIDATLDTNEKYLLGPVNLALNEDGSIILPMLLPSGEIQEFHFSQDV